MKKISGTKKAEQAKQRKMTTSKPKSTLSCDWARSIVTEERLHELEIQGLLPSQKDIGWRAPAKETRLHPKDGEVVVFVDHVTRGFRPPGSLFFRELLRFYGLHPQDLAPNSIVNVGNFTVFCCYKQTKSSGGQPM